MYAIDEVPQLVKRLKLPSRDTDPVLQYLCALFSELAYYHVPAFEFEDTKRAKLIPCVAYQTIIRSGRPTNVAMILPQNELFRYFIIVDRGVVIIGVLVNKLLFIAFRGTQFLFDWQVNVRATLAPLAHPLDYWRGLRVSAGAVHSGFGEEAVRAALKIRDELSRTVSATLSMPSLPGILLGVRLQRSLSAVWISRPTRRASSVRRDTPVPLHLWGRSVLQRT